MLTCYRCAEIIKGKYVRHVPPNVTIQLGLDFEKAFHPKCYENEEGEAAAALDRGLIPNDPDAPWRYDY